jgi:glycosyltransferase involved in cell wall biosynthesis
VSSRRLLVSAFGIHYGGGMVLLSALLPGLNGVLRGILLDARLRGALELERDVTVEYVARSFRSRILSLIGLARAARDGDVLLCFNSLPPLRKSRARVTVYVQAPHFVGAHAGIRYPRMTMLRHFIEATWLRLGIRNCDEVWVQTPTMAAAVRARFPDVRVSIVPLVDSQLAQALGSASQAVTEASCADFSFFFPSDTAGHKNHANLFKAWKILSAEGPAPRLYVTLDTQQVQAVLERCGIPPGALPEVVPLGRISRAEVMERLRASSALIFPSLTETFGLPLLEAAALRVPIVASEKDFVRDVCTPHETFDPQSPRSIARAVRRFIRGGAEPRVRYFGATEFVARLLA